MAQNDQALLTRLRDHGLEFVVIGGVCVVYHGVPMATFDLDICCGFGAENVERIEAALTDLHPVHRLTANKLPLSKRDHDLLAVTRLRAVRERLNRQNE